MFYLGVFVIVLSVFAVSALAIQGILPDLGGLFAYDWLSMALTVATLLLVYGAYRSLATMGLAKDGFNFTKIISQTLIIMALAAVFCLKTLLSFERFYASTPSAPITVSAYVHIDEISDGVHDPINQRMYRQKAILSEITPIHEPAGTSANPFYNPALTHISASDVAPLPSQMTVLLNANYAENKSTVDALKVGTTTKMTLNLTALPSSPNHAVGFDGRRYLMTRHIHANARILSVDSASLKTDVAWYNKGFVWIQTVRQALREHFYERFDSVSVSEQSAAAVTLSLLTGDRALIDGQTKELYQWAGMSHLLAISGAHVLFLAVILSKFVVMMVNQYLPRVYYRIARWQLRWIVMLMSASVYAIFVGADVPAMRTVYLLLAMGVCKWLLMDISIHRVLAVIGLIMVYIDPMSLWQAGFWLSFVAVWLLMQFGLSEVERGHTVMQLIKMQLYLFVAMLPISMLLFGKVSLVGMISNLFMVGVFGYVIVPINLLAGLVYGLLPSVADGLWQTIIMILSRIHEVLALVELNFDSAWLITPISVMMIALGFVLVVMIKSPWLYRHWLLLPMLMMVFGVYGEQKAHGIYVLPSNFATQQILIVKDETYWLIISGDDMAVNDEKFADELLITLKRFRVTQLTGVVLQHDNEKMAYAVGRVSLQMPIERFWFAGQSKRFGQVTARPCVMDKAWQQQGLTVRALTGWQTLNNPKMQTCQLWVGSDEGALPIYADKTMIYLPQATASALDEARARGVLIEVVSDDKLWALWQLLCQDVPHVDAIIGQQVSATVLNDVFHYKFVQAH